MSFICDLLAFHIYFNCLFYGISTIILQVPYFYQQLIWLASPLPDEYWVYVHGM